MNSQPKQVYKVLIQMIKIMTCNNIFNDIFCTHQQVHCFFYVFDQFVRACVAHTLNQFQYTIKM